MTIIEIKSDGTDKFGKATFSKFASKEYKTLVGKIPGWKNYQITYFLNNYRSKVFLLE